MKHILPIIAAILLAGCATNTDEAALDCDKARKIYAAYLATLELRDATEDEIKAARAAGTFLAAWCGWSALGAVKLVKPSTGDIVHISADPPEDRNGVPILKP